MVALARVVASIALYIMYIMVRFTKGITTEKVLFLVAFIRTYDFLVIRAYTRLGRKTCQFGLGGFVNSVSPFWKTVRKHYHFENIFKWSTFLY